MHRMILRMIQTTRTTRIEDAKVASACIINTYECLVTLKLFAAGARTIDFNLFTASKIPTRRSRVREPTRLLGFVQRVKHKD